MENLKKGGRILVLLSGVIETCVAFVFYWVAYAMSKSAEAGTATMNNLPFIVLLCGILGGVLLFISFFFIKNTKFVGSIIAAVATVLCLIATIYLIANINGDPSIEEVIMIVLPFFVVPNALGIAGTITLLVSSFAKSENKKAEKPEEPIE
ncbi:MAG TPA: hypothetical protein DDW20_05205 [Firmicutes bacterium]|nr:hypothetical protein [Bacillota bacterium]